ncbi:unnamed protein product, partial [Vitis vinifera]
MALILKSTTFRCWRRRGSTSARRDPLILCTSSFRSPSPRTTPRRAARLRGSDGGEALSSSSNGAFRASISGPVYITESRSGSSTPYRTSSRPSSGPLAGTLTPARRGEVEIPYLSLRELNLEQQQQQHRISTSAAMPIYLVTYTPWMFSHLIMTLQLALY